MSPVTAAALNCVLVLQHFWLCLIFASLILLHFRNAINRIFLKERKHGRDLKRKMSTNWTRASSLDAKGGEGTNGTGTNTINKVMRAGLKRERSWGQDQLSGLRRSLCPAQGPCQLELAEGAFSGWERPQSDPAGLWERSQTAGRGLVPMGCVPAAAGTNLSQTTEQCSALSVWCRITSPARCLWA